ncbi:hypothetical protein ACEUZ9_000769 [Paracoccus litorisediminis]|uniref:hypothetical protein n=1 Tax=Paracoccus litorisediminis TaxID=2006130 RepID=UPI00372E6910
MTPEFTIFRRSPDHGHWDITDGRRRIFRLRGEAGKWILIDEREQSRGNSSLQPFKDQAAAMAWLCSELMFEPEPREVS